MWILKVRIVHNCVIGNRCKKFGCTSYSMPINNWYEDGYSFTSHIHTLEGPQKNIEEFIADLETDKEVHHMEVSKNTIFLVQKRKTNDVISAHYNGKIFSVKPVHVTPEGYEFCEFASWKKEILMDFLKGMQDHSTVQMQVERFQNTKLDAVYYQKMLPSISDRQREIFHLAIQEGYYAYPRKISLKLLAKKLKLSPSTAQEHLRRAEERIMPSYIH